MYADLCLAPRVEHVEAMARMLSEWGIKLVGVEASSPNVEVRKTLEVFKSYGIEALTRITIEASSRRELLQAIRAARRRFDILAVKPRTGETARLAARDGRVDLVVLEPGMARYMDRSEALLLRQGGGMIEIQLASVMSLSPRRLRGFMIIARRAAVYEAPFTVSSCATSLWELWHPQAVRSLLVSVGVPEHIAKLALTVYPRRLLKVKLHD